MKTLSMKEFHCRACEKAFCCVPCRLKHENMIHKISGPPSLRKPMAPTRLYYLKFPGKTPSHLRSAIFRSHLKKQSVAYLKNQPREDESQEMALVQNNKPTSTKTSNMPDSARTADINTENNPPKPQERKYYPSVFGSPVPMSKPISTKRPILQEQTLLNYRDSWKSGNEMKWTTALSHVPSGISENISVYYSCSETLNESFDRRNTKYEIGGFETFVQNNKLASTQIEIRNSPTPSEDGSVQMDYLKASNLPGPKGSEDNNERACKNGCTQTSYIPITDPDCINLTSRISKNTKLNTQTQKPIKSSPKQSSIGETWSQDMSQKKDENCQESSSFYLTDQDSSSNVDNTSMLTVQDKSLWQTFSDSVQRALNSTKQLYFNLGGKKKTKRGRDDNEDQPKPKRRRILCRRSLRESPIVIFKKDGDFRRPVIGYHKGTQTNF